MGALIYEPKADHSANIPNDSSDKIAEEISEFKKYDNDKDVEDLLNLGAS